MSNMIAGTILVLLVTIHGQQSFSRLISESVVSSSFDSAEEKNEQVGTISGNAGGNVLLVSPTEQSSNRFEQQSSKGLRGESCTTKNGIDGKCVTYYLCGDKNERVIGDGGDGNDLRKRRGADEPCSSYLDTCCEVPNNLPVDVSSTPTPSTTDELSGKTQGCGWHKPNGVGVRITGEGDTEARVAKFPWMVAVIADVKLKSLIESEPDGKTVNVYVGGGSLIHPNVVLTAAHSLADPLQSQLRVRAGGWDVQTANETYPMQYRHVQEVIIHEDFNKVNFTYDVALLFLAEPVDMSKPQVGLACLPPQGRRAVAGILCQLSGKGTNRNGKFLFKRVEVSVVDREVCETQLRKTRLGADYQLHSSYMCAAGEARQDVCRGDEGSPLVCPLQNENGRYVQNGIEVWGSKCGDVTPGVYVDVAILRSWIDDKVAGHGYDPKTYTY